MKTKSIQVVDGPGVSDFMPVYDLHHNLDDLQTDTTCKILMDSDMVS